MSNKKSMTARKAFLAEIGQILIQYQLSEQKKQKNAATLEATNHNTATAETASSKHDRQ